MEMAELSLSGDFIGFSELKNTKLCRKNGKDERFSGGFGVFKEFRDVKPDVEMAGEFFSGDFPKELETEKYAALSSDQHIFGDLGTFTAVENDKLPRKSDFQSETQSTNTVENSDERSDFYGSMFQHHKTSNFASKTDDQSFSNVRLPHVPESGLYRGTNQGKIIHSQVLKIREEDSRLGEDIGEGFSTKYKLAFLHLSSQMDAFFYSRPCFPSPLGNKTAVGSVQ